MKASRLSATLVVAAFIAAPAAASTIPWINPSGTGLSFSWENGNNETDLFGSPTTLGNIWMFLDSTLGVSSSDGIASTAYDHLNVDLEILDLELPTAWQSDGFPAGMLMVYGTYNVEDPDATGNNSIEAVFKLSLDSAEPYMFSFENSTPGFGLWGGIIFYENVASRTQSHMTIDAEMLATSDGMGGTAYATAGMTLFHFIPEASSAAFLLMLGLILTRQRR